MYNPGIKTYWGRVTHIGVGKLTIIASDNDLSPGRRQAIIETNDGILLIWTLRNKFQWSFNRNSYIFIQENALENVVCEVALILSRPQCVKIKTTIDGIPFGWIPFRNDQGIHFWSLSLRVRTCLVDFFKVCGWTEYYNRWLFIVIIILMIPWIALVLGRPCRCRRSPAFGLGLITVTATGWVMSQ